MGKEKTVQDLYDDFFDLKKESDVFKVQIIKCSKKTYWYSFSIGQEFYVMDNGEADLKVMRYLGRNRFTEEGAYIQKTDAIILS